jgi:hypothetical protein
MALPDAPVVGVITPGDNTLSIAFTPGTGTPSVDKHQVRKGSGQWVDCASTSPIVLSGLANGKAVSITMRAVNADGNSAASNAVSGTPADTNPANDNGYDDASFYANPGAAVPHLDWNDPDD